MALPSYLYGFFGVERYMSGMKDADKASKFGIWVGHCWKIYLEFEKSFSSWLSQRGVAAILVRLLRWCLRALVIGLLLFAVSWVVLLVTVIAVLLEHHSSNSSPNDFDSEWRDGPSGYGLYDRTGVRLDPHDPDEMA